jgi:shikimate kinase
LARNLVLIGFMGSGKTTVGRRVGEHLGLPFVDIDDVVVAEAGQAIAEIFRTQGEPAFRRLESRALYATLRRSGQVVAPGGGAVMSDENSRRVTDDNLVVYLRASSRALLRRVRASPMVRPLVDARFRELLEARLPRYQEAEVTIETTGRTLESVAGGVTRVARANGLEQ